MIDLPFALPTAVAGIALTALYAPNGCIGASCFAPLGFEDRLHADGHPDRADLHRPALRGADRAAGSRRDRACEVEEASATLGASRAWTTAPGRCAHAAPAAILTGFALAFARAVGEYGSVIFIAGNIPLSRKSRRC
jgi:sulfate transport system permease protein